MHDDLIIGKPNGRLIANIRHRLSFLYFEYARVVKSENSLMAISGEKSCDIPAANLTVLMLGPGTSITHDALMELSRWNCSVAITSGDGLGYYSTLNVSSGSNAKFALRQAEIVSNDKLRLSTVREMYSMRWDDASFAPETSLRDLMAFEGRRVKEIYRTLAKKHGIDSYTRVQKVDFQGNDVLNQLITSANTMLYGLVNAVCVGIGAVPALGFIHHGHSRAFVFDIADFYKDKLTIPLAFELYSKGATASDMRREFRKRSLGFKLIPQIIEHINRVLGFSDPEFELDMDAALALWSEESLFVNDGFSIPLGRDE